MIADQKVMTCFALFYPTASATAYGQRPKFFRAEHSATAEGENCAYGPTLHENHDFFQSLQNKSHQECQHFLGISSEI